MAKRKKLSEEDFPRPGTVYAMKMADGHLGACRVVRFRNEVGCEGSPHLLIAACDWISDAPPSLNDPAIRRILTLNNYSWRQKNDPAVLWVDEYPPRNFQVIGHIDVLPEDTGFRCTSYGSWESLAFQVLRQWRWDHDHDAVVAEDAEAEKERQLRALEREQKRLAKLSSASFSKLLAKNLFSNWKKWKELTSEVARRGCEKIVKALIKELADHEKPLDRAFVTNQLQKCVQNLNEFNEQNGSFIETDEREDLCLVLEEVMSAAKFPDLVEAIEEWRNW